eukprot:TRINITY_DN763_c13_g1_i1.p1 TRINITY_DN763_c13_g1~~TRINITY_DN763_c13_g1_i1.p1  ORF type:complete len:581 (+),score=185.62 TRINITY_DN763_c13_g1_i1:58-1800(+)
MFRKVLLLGGVTLCAAIVEHDLSEHVRHEDSINGFSVSHVWGLENNEVVRYKLGEPDIDERKAQTEAYEEFNPDVESAAKTRTLAKLALAVAYQAETGQREANSHTTLDDIIANGDGYFNTTSYDAETAEMRRIADIIYENRKYGPVDPVQQVNTAALGFGEIFAYGFRSATNVSVLVFRGTTTIMDNIDVASMLIPYLASGLGKKKWAAAWRDDAGLPWTSRQEFNYNLNTAEDRSILNEEGKIMIAGVLGAAGKSAIVPSGFTPVVLQIAANWYQQSARAGFQTALTGHSLGGARAAVASMKLKESNITVTATTFGSTGSACWPRRNYFGYSAVNTSVSNQPQVTEYTHPIDTYGNALGRDVGRHCFWGKANIENSMAKKYCEPISGLDIAYLQRIQTAPIVQNYIATQRQTYQFLLASGNPTMVAQGQALRAGTETIAALVPRFMRELNTTELTHRKQHSQCRYFTHNAIVSHQELLKELNADGTTTSGCSEKLKVDWGNEQCPYNFPAPADSDDDFWTGKPGGPIFIIFIVITFFFLVFSIVKSMTTEYDEDEDTAHEPQGKTADSPNEPIMEEEL